MIRCIWASFVLLFACVPLCYGAGAPFNGTTTGTFGLASKTGTYMDWRKSPFFFQDPNAADAFVTGENTNLLTWGTPAPGGASSFVLFAGVGRPGFGPIAADTPFRIGTFAYFNGTINFLTGAYGASFTITPSDPTIDPLVSSYTNIDSKNYVDNSAVPFWAAPFVPAGWKNGDLISADGMILPDFGKIAA